MGLTDKLILAKSGRYANPENDTDVLPLVYGDLTENSSQGVFVPPCIDTVNHYYCLSQTPILSVANGNTILVYEDNTLITSGYTVVTDGDLESQGRIAYLNFETAPTGTITVACSGRSSGGVLITNPIDIIVDFLSLAQDTTPKNSNSFTQARYAAEYYSYTAAGLMISDNTPFYWIINILSSFLGETWINNQGELVVRIDTPLASTLQIAGNIRERNCNPLSFTGTQSTKNLVNKAPAYYAIAYTDIDRRYTEDVRGTYFQVDDGETTKDALSIQRYGERTPKEYFNFDWCRNTATVYLVQTRIVNKFKRPLWMITMQEDGYQNIQVEKGDFVLYSWEERKDENGLPLRNQIAQVLTKEIDGDLEMINWTLRDTGIFQTLAPYIWDGTINTGAGDTFGGSRDRRIL